MATTMEIVRGISQVMANTYDGAHDENGEPIKIGLKREEGHPINDSRIMDGFKVSFYGNQLCIHYHAEVKLKEVYAKDFESDLEQMIEDIASFLKKEYKKVTGSALSLKCYYDLGGLDTDTEGINEESEENIEANFKTFLDKGGFGKKDKNDSRKKPTEGQPVYVDGKVKARKNIHSSYKAE